MIGQTVGHYRIESLLAEGGMGVVYRAIDVHLDRTVAIKVLRPDAVADPERTRRFVREARAASALNHPNIVTIYDIDRSNGVDCMAMEYVPGQALDRLIDHDRPDVGCERSRHVEDRRLAPECRKELLTIPLRPRKLCDLVRHRAKLGRTQDWFEYLPFQRGWVARVRPRTRSSSACTRPVREHVLGSEMPADQGGAFQVDQGVGNALVN